MARIIQHPHFRNRSTTVIVFVVFHWIENNTAVSRSWQFSPRFQLIIFVFFVRHDVSAISCLPVFLVRSIEMNGTILNLPGFYQSCRAIWRYAASSDRFAIKQWYLASSPFSASAKCIERHFLRRSFKARIVCRNVVRRYTMLLSTKFDCSYRLRIYLQDEHTQHGFGLIPSLEEYFLAIRRNIYRLHFQIFQSEFRTTIFFCRFVVPLVAHRSQRLSYVALTQRLGKFNFHSVRLREPPASGTPTYRCTSVAEYRTICRPVCSSYPDYRSYPHKWKPSGPQIVRLTLPSRPCVKRNTAPDIHRSLSQQPLASNRHALLHHGFADLCKDQRSGMRADSVSYRFHPASWTTGSVSLRFSVLQNQPNATRTMRPV